MESSAPPPDALTRWLLASQANLSRLFLALAVVWAVPTVYGGYRAYVSREKPAEVKPETPPDETVEKPAEPKADTLEKFDPNRPSYFVVAMLGALGVLGALGGSFWWFAQTPGQGADARRTQARVAILLAGLGSGLLLMFGGLWFVFDKYEILSKWLDTREAKNLWQVLLPVFVFVVGAGLAFVAAQVARPEERHNQTARRLVYATNLVVTGLLLFVGLGVLNIFFGTKLPNRLDTTGSGFYTLDPSTEVFVKSLDQKVTAYSLLDNSRGQDEMRELLANAQDLNPSRFVLKQLGTAVSTKDAQKLRTSFPQVNLDETAVILAAGDDEKRYSTIKLSDLVTATRDERGRVRDQQFAGERVLVRELQFLAENQNKAVIYFTQGSGELALTPGPEDGPKNAMGQLRAYLEKLNLAVKPLVYDKNNVKVPADAAVVVVANPAQGVAPELAAELKRYMTEPRADGKKGKLVVIAGPNPTVKNDAVQPTGLEELLITFNVALQQAIVMTVPTVRDVSPDNAICGVTRRAMEADNPIVRQLIDRGGRIPFGNSRPMDVKPAAPGGGIEAYPLLMTVSTSRAPNWLEPVRPADPDKALLDLSGSEDLQRKKQLSATPRTVAAAAAEGGSGRVVVFGSTLFFTDATAATLGGPAEDNLGNVMMVSAVDWLRDRPVVDVANKTYGMYKPNPTAESMRLVVLPLSLTALLIAGLGAGVWVVRRR